MSLVGLALGVGIGVAFFVALGNLVRPTLPLEEGDRVVAVENWDLARSTAVRPSIEQFQAWRGELRSIPELAAASLSRPELVTGEAAPVPVAAASMTAAGFSIARVPPALGRYLLEEDEHPGATAVAVIGHDLWQRRFEGDPTVIGRPVLIGRARYTIVGVMPPGFAFPRSEEIWTALRWGGAGDAAEVQDLHVFGRLAPHATRGEATAEIRALAGRLEASGPGDALQPRVVPYTHAFDNLGDVKLWKAARIQLMVTLLLVAIAANISILVYARTALRRGELAVRAAIGATRRRVVGQLFVEALLLSLLGAALGLAAGHLALRQMQLAFGFRPEGTAFWVDHGLSPGSVLFAAGLALLAGAVIGIPPALRATGRRLDPEVRALTTNATAPLGRSWTALVVIQVAVCTTVLPFALRLGYQELRMASVRATFPAHQILSSRIDLALPLDPRMDAQEYRRARTHRLGTLLPEIVERLASLPGVAAVSFEGTLPGVGSRVLIQGGAPAGERETRLMAHGIADGYLDLVDGTVLAGRALTSGDDPANGGGVLVNEAFARVHFQGRSPLGEHLRFLPGAETAPPPTGPVVVIVGVVRDLYASALDPGWAPPTLYYRAQPESMLAPTLLVRSRAADPTVLSGAIDRTVRSLDAALRLEELQVLSKTRNARLLSMAVVVLTLVLSTVLLLCAAGVHALMSVTVTRLRREIGIRAALGANPSRLLRNVYSRVGRKLLIGAGVGSVLGIGSLLASGLAPGAIALHMAAVLILMFAAALAAARGPTRRALAVDPAEIVRES